MRTGTTGALAASVVIFVAGCGTRSAPPPAPEPAVEPATVVQITVYVKDMTKVLQIT